MVISETKLKNINYNITSIENYHFYSSNSPTNNGGIGIYLKTPLNYKIRPDLCLNEDLVEDIWVEIKSNNWDILCQLTPFSAFFGRPSPIFLKFGMIVGLDEKMFHTKFQVSKLNSFRYMNVEN